MPEPLEQPAPEAAAPGAPPTAEPTAPPKKTKAAPGTAALSRLKKKYRLDARVRLEAKGPDDQPLGWGPLMDPQVFDKLASLDPTPDKRYLDWMLYQAGGGASAFAHSRKMWGEGTTPQTAQEFLDKFTREMRNIPRLSPKDVPKVSVKLRDSADIPTPQLPQTDRQDQWTPEQHAVVERLVEAIGLPTDLERYRAFLQILNEFNVGPPDKRERIARELLSHKLKEWTRDQLDQKVRDRVHAVFTSNRLAQGMDPNAIEHEWEEGILKRKREYVLGDQDSLKGSLFGFSRHWPGKEGRYERVYNVMREFLMNKSQVERRNSQLEKYNATIAAKNQGLPPDQQRPLREPINVSLDIGKVTMDRNGDLHYKGVYDTVEKLASANDAILDMPMRERVASDIRYAGPKGKSGRSEKIYSDDNLEVLAPLTVAASVKSGDPSWDVSDPEQLDVTARGHHSTSTWTRWALGQHSHMEWEGSQIVPVFFSFKKPQMKVMLMAFIDDLADLVPPYMGTLWRTTDERRELHYLELKKMLKQQLASEASTYGKQGRKELRTYADQYLRVAHSLAKGMLAVKEWGQEFEPRGHEMDKYGFAGIVGDPVAHHRERMLGRPGLKEQIIMRARQAVELLTE